MRDTASEQRGSAQLARALGLDSNPLRRASDRAEAWIRIGLVAIFLIAGPLAALDAGHWAYHAETTGVLVRAVRTHEVKAILHHPALATAGAAEVHGSRLPGIGARRAAARSARADEVLVAAMTLACVALALLAALRLVVTFLNRLRLAAWETAWSAVGPQWTGGRP